MNKDIIVVVIGAGYWGINIINTLKKIGIKNLYVYEKNKKVQNRVKRNHNIKLIKDFNEIIDNNKFENIIISTPVEANFKIIKKLIEFNKNIFVEKPVTKNFKEIYKLKLLLKNKKTIFMCGYIYLFNTLIQYIKNLLESQKLGKIKYIEMTRKNYGPYRHHVSSLKDLGSHDLSICKYFFNKKVKLIKNVSTSLTKRNSKDKNISTFNMGNIRCIIQSSWANPTKERTLLIIGSKKILTYDELNISTPIKIYNSKYSLNQKIYKKENFKPRSKLILSNIKPKIKYTSPLFAELKHFIECIQNNKKPLTDFNFAYDMMHDLNRLDK